MLKLLLLFSLYHTKVPKSSRRSREALRSKRFEKLDIQLRIFCLYYKISELFLFGEYLRVLANAFLT